MKIPNYKHALLSRFRGWLARRRFRPHKLRGVLAGCIMTIVLCEVTCYRMLQTIVRAGDLPPHMPDMMIVAMALLEAMVSPFVSWFGYWRRRTVMVVAMPLLAFSTVSWLYQPDVTYEEDSEFCHGPIAHVTEGLSHSSAIRLAFVLSSCVLFLLARVAVWCHGFAYLEEHAPERVSVHLGVLVFVRTCSLAMDYHMVGEAVKTSQIIGFIINFIVLVLQMLYFMPTITSEGQETLKQRTEDRNFFVSIWRVLSNPLAMTQMVSLGLLSAAVWGFGYHNSDIIKVKYLMPQKSDAMVIFSELFQYYGTLMAVLYVGLRWSVPIQAEFSKLRALKQSLTMSVLVGVLLTAMTVSVTCERGRVAGLGDVYSDPGCSKDCGCTRGWMEFSPVCVVEDMTTYLSPCQAGCEGTEDRGGLMVYSNCSCAPSSLAVAGACGEGACRPARDLHRVLYVLLLTFAVLAFQSHGVVLLKTADARDKSVVMGLAGSVVAGAAFVVGHLAFNRISASSCIWSVSQRCLMHSERLPVLVGVTAAALACSAAGLCLTAFVCCRLRATRLLVTRL